VERLPAVEVGGELTVVARAMFSCVTENGESWFVKVQNLVLSIREFGGSQSHAPILVNFVDGVESRFAQWLSRYDVAVRVVEPVDPVIRYTNKLRMFEVPQEMEAEILVALDCDVVVVGDIGQFLSSESISAKPADRDMLSDSQWRRIFRALEIAPPARTFVTTSFGQRTYPYANSGVLLVPRHLCKELLSNWAQYARTLEEVYRSAEDLALRKKYTDQIALTCALAAGRFPVRALPVTMNMPTHINIRPTLIPSLDDVRIVHYHGGLDDQGFLRRCRYPAVNRTLDLFNQRRSEVLSLTYHGLPRRPLVSALKQELTSSSWYHAETAERLRAYLRTRLEILRAWPRVRAKGRS
jgi:hypothetical protein